MTGGLGALFHLARGSPHGLAKKDKSARAAAHAEPSEAWVEGVEARLRRIEAALAQAGGAPADAEPEAEGRVRLTVRSPRVEWRHEITAGCLMAADWPAQAARLGALGHPVRLAILRAVASGTNEATALQLAAGAATPGQFYHHLRELTATGWLVSERRGLYALPPGRAGALMAALALAMAG